MHSFSTSYFHTNSHFLPYSVSRSLLDHQQNHRTVVAWIVLAPTGIVIPRLPLNQLETYTQWLRHHCFEASDQKLSPWYENYPRGKCVKTSMAMRENCPCGRSFRTDEEPNQMCFKFSDF